MKRVLSSVLCAMLSLLLLSGCGIAAKAKNAVRNALSRSTAQPYQATDAIKTQAAVVTKGSGYTLPPLYTAPPSSTDATDTPDIPDTPSATGLSGNREDLSEQEILDFFRLVVFGDGQDGVVMKWAAPVVVSVSGSYNSQDDEQLTGIFDMINYCGDFPGITYLEAAGPGANANMHVQFVTESELRSAEAGWNGEYSCYVSYNYNDGNELTQTKIYLVSDWVQDQAERNYLLTWGVFFSIGLFNDTAMYYDSIFNPDFTTGGSFETPAACDWYLVYLLYSPAVEPGMTKEEAVNALVS